MSEKKMVKETIEEREYAHLTEAIQALTRFNYAGLNADLIEHMDGWKVVLFKWVEEKPKPFIAGGYINAKALTELKADEQVINFEKIKEEALRQYGKEVEKEVANLARETYEKLYKEERDAFIESIKPKGYKDGGVIATEVEDEPIPTKPMKFIEKAMNNPEYKVQADKIMKEYIDEVLNNRVDKANEKKTPKFKAGDKVIFANQILTLDAELPHPLRVEGDEGKAWRLHDFCGWLGENQFRHATREEVFWIDELGRDEVGDFLRGDLLLYKHDEPRCLTENHDFDYAEADYEAGLVKGIYPTESFKVFDWKE